mmetsp:Transcript_95232/g.274265  ORF Transcript_95232/g.274265 Transcript_95232/m.274265 type:complete len:208 (+) Transcript_95232:987-1610(+)
MWVACGVLFDERAHSQLRLFGDDLGLFLKCVQHRLEDFGQVWQECLRSSVRDGLHELEAAGLGFLRRALLDAWEHGAIKTLAHQVPPGEQNARKSQACTTTFHLGNIVVHFVALKLVQKIRHDLVIAQRWEARSEGSQALRRLELDAFRRMHQALPKQWHQLAQIWHEELGIRDQIHRRSDNLHALHLRVMRLLSHRAAHDREDEAE